MVPQTPYFLQGVINLRRKFDMLERDITELTCIVVVRLRVDGVVEVLTLNSENIEDSPNFGLESARSCVREIAEVKGKVKMLLDIDQFLGGRELESFVAAP